VVNLIYYYNKRGEFQLNTTYLAVGLFILVLVIILLNFSFRKKNTAEPTKKNRRNAFRLSLWEHECTFIVPASPDSVLFGTIRDISISGMRLITYEDLTDVDEIKVFFELGEDFSFVGKIERRKRLKNGKYDFGVHFLGLDEKAEQKLFKILWDKSREKVVL
jgi:c-di-GMP-binding flagellar brake protein YcgR